MKCYKSKWILTSENGVLEDYALIVDDGKIINIIPNSSVNLEEKNVKDLGNSVITPGFVDLFTQFQYTNIPNNKTMPPKNKIKKFFLNLSKNYTFAGVKPDNYSLKWANIMTDYCSSDRGQKLEAFKIGATEAIKSGTTCFAQVSREFKYFDIINKLPVKNYLFFEVFSDSREKSKKTFKELRNRVEDLLYHKGENTHIGIMLNSISGVHKKLWDLFSKYCRKHNMLIVTRFAESLDEIEWLQFGFSDIDLLHKFLGLRKITPYSRGLSPVEYLANLKVLTNKIIAANANYADDDDLKKLAGTGVKFIYQPYYSDEICNKKLDFQTVLKYFDGNFGFSTQSFRTDKDFSLLNLANKMNAGTNLQIEELLKYLTIYPAKILRLDNVTGSIKVGKDADFNVFKLSDGEDYKALKRLSMPDATYSKGRKIVKDGKIRFSL